MRDLTKYNTFNFIDGFMIGVALLSVVVLWIQLGWNYNIIWPALFIYATLKKMEYRKAIIKAIAAANEKRTWLGK